MPKWEVSRKSSWLMRLLWSSLSSGDTLLRTETLMQRRDFIRSIVAIAAVANSHKGFGLQWSMTPLHSGYSGQHIMEATKRWLAITYPSSAASLSSVVFGSDGNAGYVTLSELEATSKHFAPFQDVDGSLAVCTSLTVAYKLDTALAALGGPPISGRGSLSCLVFNPILAGKGKLLSTPRTESADHEMLHDIVVSAVIEKSQT